MWHEIRKQERKIRCMIVDYKRRAERRRDYYEKIKADPTQFLQIHGRSCKIHLDPQIAAAGDSPAVMMSWQGAQDVMIDRFDVRAHLDYIQEYKGDSDEKLSYDERLNNYERYRILVQNDFLGVTEEKFLHQIFLEEQFGAVKSEPQPLEGKKKIAGAAIGYNYDEPTTEVQQPQVPLPPPEPDPDGVGEDEDEDDSDIDFDMCVDVNKVSTQQAHELNNCGHIFGMDGNDFFSFLTKDKEEADNLRIAKELEEEKAMYSGRKSRRERRAYRDKKLAGRKISPPSYASRKSPTYRDYCDLSRSRSKSASPVNSGKITYITCFSVEEPVAGTSPKVNPHKSYKSSNDDHRSVKYRSRTPEHRRHRYRSRSRSRSKEQSHRRRSRSRSRSHSNSSKSRYRSSRRSTSISWSHNKSSSLRDSKSTRSKSKSPSRSTKVESKPQPIFNPAVPVKQPPAPIISRYYGRRGQSSSSELSLTEDEDEKTKPSDKQSTGQKKPWTDFGNSSGRNKAGSSSMSSTAGPRMTPQERLKKKMQALLNKQYKADKKAEREKKEKEEQERLDREDEMREMSIKLRKRERRRRHEHLSERRRSGSSQSMSSQSSRSRSWSPAPRRERRGRRRSKSRSRSRSRSRDRPPVHGPGPRPLVDY